MNFLLTPTILLALLCGPRLLQFIFGGTNSAKICSSSTAGCIGIALMFVFTGVGHFLKPEPMSEMLPPFIPSSLTIVYASGVLEILAGIAILPVRIRKWVAWGLIAMLIAFLPLNIYAAFNRIGPGGHTMGPIYLLLRVPLQIVFVVWIYWFGVRGCINDNI